MKGFKLLVIIAFAALSSAAQDYHIPLKREVVSKKTAISQISFDKYYIHVSLDAVYGIDVKSQTGEKFTELYFGKGYSAGDIGEPKLPAIKNLIQIPSNSNISVKVSGYSINEYRLKDFGIETLIYPNQPSVSKEQDIKEVPFYINKAAYQESGFSNESIATIEVLGTIRGIRIARLQVNPIQYDPTQGVIRVYNDIDVHVTADGASIELEREIAAKTYSPFFEPVLSALSSSFTKSVFDEKPDLTKYPIKMQVISHRMFEQTLKPYVDWKTQKGFIVDVAYTDQIGTTDQAIISFMQNLYTNSTPENPLPTFLVIVGDVEQVPASATGSSSKKKTDLYYAALDDDYFPEMYYGRLSAQTTGQLKNIIDKIIYYEQYHFEDPSYLSRATLIAGVDATWNPRVGEPTVKYATKNYYNPDNGISTVWGYGVANDPSNPNNSSGYTGCYDNERLSVGFINYTAHCSESIWDSPRLTIDAVNGMSNYNKYPLAIGNCCLSADFGYSESIGEAWIRAENKGAVTYIGSSPSSYWYEDFYWAVGAFPIVGTNNGYVPSREETTLGAFDAPHASNYLTTGALVFVGNLAVTEAVLKSYVRNINQSSSALYYWQAYNVLGDPSLIPYFTESQNNNVVHPNVLTVDQSSLTISALPGSYIAISKDNNLLGTSYVNESGETELTINSLSEPAVVKLVITRPQTKPYFADLPVVNTGEPYIILQDFNVNDEVGNNNSKADYGEEFNIDITVKNFGEIPLNQVTAKLIGEDDNFSILSTESIVVGGIDEFGVSNTISIQNAFRMALSSEVEDRHVGYFTIELTDGKSTWSSELNIQANAPKIELGDINIIDDEEGINGLLEPGEVGILKIKVKNIGGSISPKIAASLSITTEDLTIEGNTAVMLEPIPAQEDEYLEFTLVANSDIIPETAFALNLLLSAGAYSTEHEIGITVGKLPEVIIGTADTVCVCNARFYDSGGPDATYSHEEDILMVFYPETQGKMLSFNFEYAFIEGRPSDLWDKLYVFDGDSVTAPEFPGSPFSNSDGIDIGTITATNPKGAVTFRFTSDGSVALDGWSAIVTCKDPILYNVSFTVNNSKQEHIDNATITILDLYETFSTDASGLASVFLPNGDYNFVVNADQYLDYQSTFTVKGVDLSIPINLVSVAAPVEWFTHFQIFPNPVAETLYLKGISNVSTIEFLNLYGQKVLTVIHHGQDETTFPVSTLHQGLYIMNIINSRGQKRSYKILKY